MDWRRYDSSTTTFDPAGHLYQVQYAMEAEKTGATVLGILAKDGIVLASEKRNRSRLLIRDENNSKKLSILNDNMVCATAGLAGDADILINHARQVSQHYLVTSSADIPCEQLVRSICNLKQGYTQHGGLRPFGVSILFAGWDPERQFQLYKSDPSGNYVGWKATSIGQHGSSARKCLERQYEEDGDLKGACRLAFNILKDVLMLNLNSQEVEFATIEKNENGHISCHLWSVNEIDFLVQECSSDSEGENIQAD